MSLTIELDEQTETRLRELARLRGMDVGGYARQLLTQDVRDDENAALLRLFAEWDREDAGLSEEELQAEQADWDKIRVNLDRRRVDLRPCS